MTPSNVKMRTINSCQLPVGEQSIDVGSGSYGDYYQQLEEYLARHHNEDNHPSCSA